MFTPHNSDTAFMIRLGKYDGGWLSAEKCLCSIYIAFYHTEFAILPKIILTPLSPNSASFTQQTV